MAVEVGLLRQQAEARLARQPHEPAISLLAAGDDLEERGLAGPVGAHQADALTAGERGADRVEDDEVADLAAHALEAQDGHVPKCPRFGGADVGARGPGQSAGSGPPRSDQLRPRRPTCRALAASAAVVPRRSAAGRRWHHEQKWVPR